MDKASLTWRQRPAWQTVHVSFSCLSRLHQQEGSSAFGQTLSQTWVSSSPLATLIWPACILRWCPPWKWQSGCVRHADGRAFRERLRCALTVPDHSERADGLQTHWRSCFLKTTTHLCVTVTEKDGRDFSLARWIPAPGLFLATTLGALPFRRTVTCMQAVSFPALQVSHGDLSGRKVPRMSIHWQMVQTKPVRPVQPKMTSHYQRFAHFQTT